MLGNSMVYAAIAANMHETKKVFNECKEILIWTL